MATPTEEVVAGLESVFKRPLTEDEKDSVLVWYKCKDLAHFVEGFPQEWQLLKEMFERQLTDFREQWISAIDRAPGNFDVSFDVMHAQVYAATSVINSIIQGTEMAGTLAKQVPEIVKEGASQLHALPDIR